ncbi:MAG: DUF1552 domain-containing protein [Myxococcaceae bacterium]
MSVLTRRALLRASALLPFAPALARAAPDAPRAPRNLVVLYHPNGLEPGWKPSVVDGALVLPPVLAALQPFASRLLCVHGLKNGVRNEVASHQEGMTSLWTGAQIRNGGDFSAWPSFDQLIAERLGTGAPFSSLELGVQSQLGLFAGGNDSVMIYDRAGRRQPDDDPANVFSRVFGGDVSLEAQARVRANRQSVIDLVKGDLARLRPGYGAAEQRKLDAHLEGVRALEQRLDAVGRLECSTTRGRDAVARVQGKTDRELASSELFPTLIDLQFDLLTLALECGLTRVGSVQLSNSTSATKVPGTTGGLGLHVTMHTGTRAEKVLINQFFAGQTAKLLAKLDAVKRPDGSSLLDETLVVWGTEMAVGNHLRDPVPFFVAGGHPTLGAVQTGKLIETTQGDRTTRLLLAVMQAFGVSGVETLGDLTDASSRGALPGVLR